MKTITRAAKPSNRKTKSSRQRNKKAWNEPKDRGALPVMGYDQAPRDHGGFVDLVLGRVSWKALNGLNGRKHRAGRPAYKLSRAQLLVALLFHYTVTWAGTFAEHLFLLGLSMAESTLSQRRQALPFAVFEELLGMLLKPIEQPSQEAFYRGLRLLAFDGTEFSLPNTEQVKQNARKGGNQRGRAAFAKLRCSALVELVMHNPLAVRLGLQGESEWKLTWGLLEQLPSQSLVLADRLYGCGALILEAMKILGPRQGHVLMRVKESLKVVRVIQRLADGSSLVEIKALDPDNRHRILGTTVVREIRARVQRPGYRSVAVRLWSSLLDWKEAPAQELVQLYMIRWEEELYFRELKRELKVNHLLRSQTVETAAQEVAAMIIGSALIAGERATLRPGEELSHRISFIKTWETLEPLWMTLLLGADLLTEEQKQQLADRFYWLASRRVIAKKRPRSCPRVLRQTTRPWPRKKDQQSHTGPVTVKMLKKAP
jgi:hypothetical protein